MQDAERRKRRLRSLHGEIELELWYGRDGRGRWHCPLLVHGGIGRRQTLTPALRRRLGAAAALSATYAEAAELCREFGLEADDSTLHRLVSAVGAKAQEQARERVQRPAAEAAPAAAPAPLGVVMLDGCMLRFRGADWGRAKPSENHVEWHEIKVGVYYRTDAGAVPENQRRWLADKRVVLTQGGAEELGQRLHWEAQAEGVARARSLRCVSDGAAWIWNLVGQRWSQAEQVLDFYHASQHLHGLAEALHGEASPVAARTASRWRRRLRRGLSGKLLDEWAALEAPGGEAGQTVRREQAYFATHRHRMNYRQRARTGPIGSGTVESACRTLQCRYKRAGQFWSRSGLANLTAIREARLNRHWEQLWQLD